MQRIQKMLMKTGLTNSIVVQRVTEIAVGLSAADLEIERTPEDIARDAIEIFEKICEKLAEEV